MFFQPLTLTFFRYTCSINRRNQKVIAMYRLTIALLLISSFAIVAEPVYEIEDILGNDEGFDIWEGLDDKDLAEIDAMLDRYDYDLFEEARYVCVASFRSEKKAKAMSMGLNVAGYEVIVRSALVNGSDYYRVLVGPLPADKNFQQEFIQWLSDMGYEGVWVLKGVRGTSSKNFLDFDDEPVVLQQPKEQAHRTEPQAYSGEYSDYNLARLPVVTD